MAFPLSLDQTGVYQSRAWAEIDLAAIRHNVRALRRHLSPAPLMAVVKADGYGLGALPVARAAIEAGAVSLAVATCEEGQELRRGGIGLPVLVLGYVPLELVPQLVEANLTPTVHSPAMAQALSRAALRYRGQANPLPVHLKLETGLNRYGLPLPQVLELCRLITSLPALHLQGLYSHFATGDEPDRSFIYEQLGRYKEGLEVLARHGFDFPQTHLSNSASGIRVKEARCGFVRVGLALYGYYPSAVVEAEARQAGLDLRPALTLKSVIAGLSRIEAGESVGYNRTYVAPHPTRLALIPLGYADGYPRALSNKAAVLIKGQRAPLVGRISMDQFSVDVSAIDGIHEGDEVTLVGWQGQAAIALEELARHCDTISYEILTGLGRRIRRVYLNP